MADCSTRLSYPLRRIWESNPPPRSSGPRSTAELIRPTFIAPAPRYTPRRCSRQARQGGLTSLARCARVREEFFDYGCGRDRGLLLAGVARNEMIEKGQALADEQVRALRLGKAACAGNELFHVHGYRSPVDSFPAGRAVESELEHQPIIGRAQRSISALKPLRVRKLTRGWHRIQLFTQYCEVFQMQARGGWCFPSVSSGALRTFEPALSPDQLEKHCWSARQDLNLQPSD